MQQYLLRRLLLFVPTMALASLAIFTIMRVLPGDVALIILGSEDASAAAMENLELLRESMGLNRPLPVQYVAWAWSLINGQFGGTSLVDNEPLSQIISRRLPVTLQLTLYTVVIAWVVSIPMGMIAAVYQNRWPDYTIRILTLLGHALPNFWIGLMLIVFMLLVFRWATPLFYVNVWEDPWEHTQKIIWPALVLAWGYSSYLARVTRSNMLEVLRQDYVRTARSKGLTERVVIARHSLRNALIPVITLGGLQMAALLSGTVILENIFSIPGIGQGIVLAAGERDYPVIQSLTMLLVFMMLSVNLIVDTIYAWVDPRISYS